MTFATQASALRSLATALLAAVLFAAPVAFRLEPRAGSFLVEASRAVAKDGDRSDSGSGSGRSGSSDDGGSRGSDSGSGSDRGRDDGGDDDHGDDRDDDRDDRREEGRDDGGRNGGMAAIRGGTIELIYPQGWREKIENGILVLKDPAGRIVIRRRATAEDVRRLLRY